MHPGTLLAVVLGGWVAGGAPPEGAYDVVVYGGTSGGIIAAVQAVRMGKSVLLVEPSRHLGGLTTGGLGATDIGNKAAIGGLAREFYRRVRKHYEDDSAWTREKRADFKGRGHEPGDDAAWTFEPHVADRIYRDLIREHKVPVITGERLDLKHGVRKDGARIREIVTESGKVFRGRVFIDATYEGDLMARAGVSYHVGREANRTYGETLNGVQVRNALHHQFVRPVDPYVKPGDPASGLLPRVHAGPPGEDGEGDHRVQAYNYRLCATDHPDNRRPWPRPAGYDEREYELLLRNFEAGDLRLPWNPVLMPNRKTDSNNNFAFSTDDIGNNYDYPDGGYATRDRVSREHARYTQGLMWTLANHPRVPEKVRRHYQTWGLARDEFPDNDNWPTQLYVREARRMVGPYVMTEHDCRGARVAADPAGLAAYTMDSHNVQRYATKDGRVLNEGDVQVGGFPPYPVSYRSIVPTADQCTNLLVPVCLSASHIAYGSIRMEPVFMVLGQSAATAASLALDAAVGVQEVDYPRLRLRLLADGQVLEWKGPRRAVRPALDSRKLPGVVLDDEDAQRDGFTSVSSALGPYVNQGYRHDGGTGRTEEGRRQRATYTPDLPAPGRYEVRLSYSPGSNRATNVPVTVVHADGKTAVTVNQRQPPLIDGAFVSLGVFRFDQGRQGRVEVANAGADGHVIIDGVQWLPRKD